MEKPFVYLFTSPNRKYCFDVNTNQIITISNDLYDMLCQWVTENKGPSAALFSNVEYQKLKSRGFLSSTRAEKMEHLLSPYLKTNLERNVKLLVLQVTQDCNFRCRYCTYTSGAEGIQRKHTKQKMSWETARMAVDYLVCHSIDAISPGISFYGGEPLLEFDLIKEVVEYAEKRFLGRQVLFNTTVNGSLLSLEKCAFLQKHNFQLLVSLDGTKVDHDKNRVFAANGEGTFDVVMNKLEMLVKQFPKLAKNTTVNMVVDSEAAEVIFDLSKLYPKVFPLVGVRGTFIDNSYLENNFGLNKENGSNLARRYILQDALAILAVLGKDISNDVAFISKESIKRALIKCEKLTPSKPIPLKSAPSGPCIPGSGRLFVTCEGKLFPCERVSETSSNICLGNIQTGVLLERAYQFLNVAQATSEKCRNCFAFRHCNVCGRVCCDSQAESVKLRTEACQYAKENCVFELKLKTLLQEASEIYEKNVVW